MCEFATFITHIQTHDDGEMYIHTGKFVCRLFMHRLCMMERGVQALALSDLDGLKQQTTVLHVAASQPNEFFIHIYFNLSTFQPVVCGSLGLLIHNFDAQLIPAALNMCNSGFFAQHRQL